MNRFELYLQQTEALLRRYQGDTPLVHFLKHFFSEHKKLGSRDRKAISSMAYCYFRTGLALGRQPTAQNLLKSLFLCGQDGFGTLQVLAPDWFAQLNGSAAERLHTLNIAPEAIFPFKHLLDHTRDAESLAYSMLQQPDLFIRIRPGKWQAVTAKLEKAGIPFSEEGSRALRLPNGSKLDELIDLNREAVIQDLSSQQVFDAFPFEEIPQAVTLWDACAASGGKSILFCDTYSGKASLTLTDSRKTILRNARARMAEAGIPVQFFQDIDLVKDDMETGKKWDLIILDVPCTGSGTWTRTPEQLFYFREESLSDFSEKQKIILEKAAAHVHPGGWLIYMTCSVLEAENAGVCEALAGKGFEKISTQYLDGSLQKADSMFSAVFRAT